MPPPAKMNSVAFMILQHNTAGAEWNEGAGRKSQLITDAQFAWMPVEVLQIVLGGDKSVITCKCGLHPERERIMLLETRECTRTRLPICNGCACVAL